MAMRRWALVVGATVLVLGQQACSGSDDPPVGALPSGESVAPPTTPPVTTQDPSLDPVPSPSPSNLSAAELLSGKRQVEFAPVVGKEQTGAGQVMSVTKAGRADVGKDGGDRALFVPVETRPRSERFLVKTGKLVKGGEPYCLEVTANGSSPLTVITAACDAGEKNQQFRFQKQKDGFLVSSDGVYLYWRPNGKYGLIAQESGEGDDLTTWQLHDQGPATVPDLD
jgi:hypothetical protein